MPASTVATSAPVVRTKTRILDEFRETCSHQRKAALRLLNRPLRTHPQPMRPLQPHPVNVICCIK